MRWKVCIVYLDYFIAFSCSSAEHVDHVDHILLLIGEVGVTLKLEKCHFFMERFDYLGHVIIPGKLAIAEGSTTALPNVLFSQTPTQVRYIMGVCNVYRRFIEG